MGCMTYINRKDGVMKHTKGKWDVAKIISGDAVVYHSLIRADKKRSIATILQNSNAEANANLIASAPKMLAELKMVAIGLKQIDTAWARERVGYAEEAIAKAEGK